MFDLKVLFSSKYRELDKDKFMQLNLKNFHLLFYLLKQEKYVVDLIIIFLKKLLIKQPRFFFFVSFLFNLKDSIFQRVLFNLIPNLISYILSINLLILSSIYILSFTEVSTILNFNVYISFYKF